MYKLIYNHLNELQYIKYFIPIFNKEIALIQWLPNAKTIKHGHNNKDCNMYVLNGNLIEKVYNYNKLINTNLVINLNDHNNFIFKEIK